MEKETPIESNDLRSVSRNAMFHTFSVLGELKSGEFDVRFNLAKKVANAYRQELKGDSFIDDNGEQKLFEDLPPETQQEILNVFLIQHGICYAILDLQRREKPKGE